MGGVCVVAVAAIEGRGWLWLHLRRLGSLWSVVLCFLLVIGCGKEGVAPVTAECDLVPVTAVSGQPGALDGPVHSLHVVGEMVYLGVGNSFGILDGSNGAEPRIVGSVRLDVEIGTIFTNFSVRDGLAYLTWNRADFTIDVSNPPEPVQVRCASPVPWPAAESAFGGRYFIFNSYLGGIRIEERPLGGGGPVEVGSFTVFTPPELVWERPPDQLLPLPALTEREPMYVRRYAFDDRYLYLLNVLRIPGDYCCGAVTILDMENAAEPGHVSTTQLPVELAPFSVMAQGQMLFVRVNEPRGYSPEILVFDMANKRRPEMIATIPGSMLPVVHDGYAYFPGSEAVDIWDLEDEDGPVLVGRIEIPGVTDGYFSGGENRMAFVGDYIYFGGISSLAILNNEDPANPYFLRDWDD